MILPVPDRSCGTDWPKCSAAAADDFSLLEELQETRRSCVLVEGLKAKGQDQRLMLLSAETAGDELTCHYKCMFMHFDRETQPTCRLVRSVFLQA